jgi:hypothetical protein
MLRFILLSAPFTFLGMQSLAGAPPDPSTPLKAGLPLVSLDQTIVERFLAEVEKPPVSYRALRRLEASSAKLQESAWVEAVTEYDRGC